MQTEGAWFKLQASSGLPFLVQMWLLVVVDVVVVGVVIVVVVVFLVLCSWSVTIVQGDRRPGNGMVKT